MPNLSGKLSLDGSQYNKTMSDAEKQNAHFARQVNSANRTLDTFQRQARTATSSISGLANSFRSGDIMGFATGLRGAATAITSLVPAGASAATALSTLGTAAMTALGPIGLITAAIAAIAGVGIASISAVEDFDASLRSLSALTGVTGETLNEVGDGAIELSNKFGVASKDIVGSMEKIGSQAPQLLGDMDALNKVTEAAIVLKKAAGNISMDEASAAVTTVMNQMGVSAEHATDIINTLAAGSQKGAADINYLNQAIAKSGSQASAAGMGYQQLVGAIETIAPKFASAEVAGTALNTLLVRLQTQGESKFNPAVVGMEQALDNLAAANLSAEEKVKLFGQSALLAGNTLIESRKAYQDMTDAVTGTNTTYEQMETRSGGLATTWEKLKNQWNNFLIVIGQSAPIQAVIAALSLIMKTVGLLINGLSKLMQAFNTVTKVIGALVQKLWTEGFKPWWDKIVTSITNSQIYKSCAKIFKAIYDFVYKVISNIKQLWDRFMEWLGIKSKKEQTLPVKMKVDDKELKDAEAALGSSKTAKTGSTKSKVDFDTGSIDEIEDKIAKLKKSLTSKKFSLIDKEKTLAEIRELEQQASKMKIAIGLEAKENSIEGLEKQISEIDDQLNKLDPTIDKAEILDLQIKKDALEEAKKNVEAAINGVQVTGKKFKTEGQAGSFQEASDKVSYYTQKLNLEVEGTEDYEYLVERIKEWTKKKHDIEIRVNADLSQIPENTLEWFDNKIQQIEAELKVTAVSSPRYDELVAELKKLKSEQQEVKIKVEADTSGAATGSLSAIEKQISNVKAKIQLEAYGTDKYYELRDELKQLEKDKHKIEFSIECDDAGFMDVKDGVVGMIEGFDAAYNSIDNLVSTIENSGNAWEIFMAGVQAVSTVLDTVASTIQTVTTILEILGITTKAVGAIEKEQSMEETMRTQQTVANATTTVAAKEAESIASATASGARMPYPLNIIAIVMGIAAVIAALSMIAGFADGGIISGKTTIGDMNLARVNSGEMILNSRQQGNLFKAIDQDRLGGGGGTANIAGDVVVRGDKMHLLLRNYNKSKTGKDIGIR